MNGAVDLTDAVRRLTQLVRDGHAGLATAEADVLLEAHADDAGLLRFAGLLRCQLGELSAGIGLLRRALALVPDNVVTRLALVHALGDARAFDEARALCTPTALASAGEPLLRLLIEIETADGRHEAAAAALGRIVTRHPDDGRIWRQLGDAFARAGDWNGAIAALRQAVALLPQDLSAALALSHALIATGGDAEAKALLHRQTRASLSPPDRSRLGGALRHAGDRAGARAVLREGLADRPDDADLLVEIGLTHGDDGDYDEAERCYRAARSSNPSHAHAFHALGLLYEHLNRAADLAALVEDVGSSSMSLEETALVRAYAQRRAGNYVAALETASSIPDSIEPARRWQLVGECADRLGETARAFDAFLAMNAATKTDAPGARDAARRYRERIGARILRTFEPASRKTAAEQPVFLLGPPRSGTTLLDTFLMGHPDVAVLEELPIVQRLDTDSGWRAGTASLSDAEAVRLRRVYLAAAATAGGGRPLVVDKHPLHLVHLALIRRLFPDARFLFMARHPCDVVLSCLTTHFSINEAMASYLDLDDAAAFHDLLMRCWTTWGDVPADRLLTIRYEALIASPEREIDRLVAFLGIKPEPAMLDHRSTAAARPYIASASYAQVTEPLHARSVERWRRYRLELARVLPVLAPWAAGLGYEM